MSLIKFDRIVSVNSESVGHEAKNLLQPSVDVSKSWLCSKGCEKGVVIVKMERASVINKVDIGNAHSAFVEVLVGRASDASDQFQTLIATSTFMSPNESKTGNNKNQVRFFTTNEFDQEAIGKQWDLIKIVCSQPFDKSVSYGLCFIKIHGEPAPSLALKPPVESTIAVGSFFRKRKEESIEGQKTLSISEQIRKAEKDDAQKSPLPKSPAQMKLKPLPSKGKPRNQSDSDESDNRHNPDFGLDEPSPKKKRIDDSESKKLDKSERDDEKLEKKRRDEDRAKKEKEEIDKKRNEDKLKADKAKQKEREDETKKKHSKDDKQTPRRGEKESKDGQREKTEKQDRKESKEKYTRKEVGTPPSRSRRKRKPFHRLLEDVVFVLSGYQNPERANYRSHATAMGAKYSQDWNDRCTHLIAAFINTPKCNQVRGKGKIVNKDWVEKCYSDRKRYPWRRFALDKADKKQPESEEEIDEEQDSPTQHTSQPSSSGYSSSNLTATPTRAGAADANNDDPTDEEADKPSLLQALPDFFGGKTFHVDDSISDKALLERYIIAYNGVISEVLNQDVKYFVTLQRGPILKHLLSNFAECQPVSPTWIQSVNCAQKFIKARNFLIEI